MEQPLSPLSLWYAYLKIRWIITEHHKNLDTIIKQKYQETGLETK